MRQSLTDKLVMKSPVTFRHEFQFVWSNLLLRTEEN